MKLADMKNIAIKFREDKDNEDTGNMPDSYIEECYGYYDCLDNLDEIIEEYELKQKQED